MRKYVILICIILGWIVCYSCKNQNIEDLIDDGNYKYWFCVSEHGNISYRYFGNDGKYEVFIKNKASGFHRYNSAPYEDDLIPQKWEVKKDSIGWDSYFYHIVDIRDDIMIIERKNNKCDTLYPCYKGMIPKEFDHKW